MSSLEMLYVSRVNSEMHTVLAQMRALNSHVSFLAEAGAGPSIDARELLRCATESRRLAMQLRHKLVALSDMGQSVTRRALGESYGAFKSNFEGTRRRIAQEFDVLDVAIRRLDSTATDRINEPGRWGDAASSTAVNEVIGFIGQLLEMWRLLRVRDKMDH